MYSRNAPGTWLNLSKDIDSYMNNVVLTDYQKMLQHHILSSGKFNILKHKILLQGCLLYTCLIVLMYIV